MNKRKLFTIEVKKGALMTRGQFNEKFGLESTLMGNVDESGYYLEYSNGYKHWMPFDAINENYKPNVYENGRMTFGQATELAKLGFGVGRKGWNGSGMFAYIVPENKYVPQTKIAKEYFGGREVPYRAYWALKTAQDDIAMWAPSGSDSLAEDWEVAFTLTVDQKVYDKIQIIY